MSLASDLRILWRARGFRRLAYVRLMSQGGDGMFQVGIATAFFFDPTHATSGRDIAIGFATLLAPFTLVGPFVGPLTDRWQRQRIVLVGNLVRLVLVGAIIVCVAGGAPQWTLYALALLTLSVNRFLLAALTAGIPRVVPASELLAANSVLPTLGTLAAALGGAIGAVASFVVPGSTDSSIALAALIGAAVAFGMSSWLTTLLARTELGPVHPLERLDFLRQVRELFAELMAGVRHLAARRTPVHALGVMAAQRFLYGMLFVAAILMSRSVFGPGGGSGSGDGSGTDALANFTIVLGFAAIGFGLAAVITPLFGDRVDRHRWIVVCLFVGAVGQGLLAMSTEVWALLTAAVIVSFAVQGSKIAIDTIIQRDTDDEVRGRAFTLYDVLYNVAFISAAVVAGWALPDSGYSAGVMAGLVLAYVVVALIYWRTPRRPPSVP
ncbi:MFS transporter [Demequina sp.]|uniref:MFS transporter n=1 Tax=Demequina sp. TaxID=2050685 RepID=UPI003D11D0FD